MGYQAGHEKKYEKTNTDNTVVKQKEISDEAVNKIVYDIMSSDQGLSQLLSGQNLAGGSNSSTATLQVQDFTTKLVGEIAKLRAADVEKTDGTVRKGNEGVNASAKGNSVICTELVAQGKLDHEMHEAAYSHWLTIHPLTKRGYWSWSTRVVPLMQKSARLSNFLAPICTARYTMITKQKWNLLGSITIYLGHPICFTIGAILSLGDIRVHITLRSS